MLYLHIFGVSLSTTAPPRYTHPRLQNVPISRAFVARPRGRPCLRNVCVYMLSVRSFLPRGTPQIISAVTFVSHNAATSTVVISAKALILRLIEMSACRGKLHNTSSNMSTPPPTPTLEREKEFVFNRFHCDFAFMNNLALLKITY